MGADPEKASIRKGREGRVGCTGGPDASIMVVLFSSVQKTLMFYIRFCFGKSLTVKGGLGDSLKTPFTRVV